MNTKVIEILKDTVCDGQHVQAEDLVETSVSTANYLIAKGKARPAPVVEEDEEDEEDED